MISKVYAYTVVVAGILLYCLIGVISVIGIVFSIQAGWAWFSNMSSRRIDKSYPIRRDPPAA